jgi:starch synthase
VRITFAASEGVPFSKTGGLADVVGALPRALAASGHEVQLLLPRYRMTKPGKPLPGAKSLTLPLGIGFKFASIQDGGVADGVRTFLVDLPEYFDRDGLYQDKGQDWPDNHLRYAAFSFACLEFLKRSANPPDVLHCHDWQAALVPIYLRSLYSGDPFFEKTAVVQTIHNLGYQGLFPAHILSELGLPAGLFAIDGLEFWGKVNLLKGGILFSDFVTTVSRKYAEEIQTPEFGYGLEGVLRSRGERLQGILNGVDYDAWNPTTDKLLPANYSPEDLKGKEACKKALLEKMGVAQPVLDRPVIGIVSRFATQKGFDLIAGVAEELMAMDLYIVALGTGEPEYEELFQSLTAKYPDKFRVKVAYDNTLAHLIEAGADMFLMPSRYEPCGLNQIYSLRYGTVPIVRATGGLYDTVKPFDPERGEGVGFRFSRYEPNAFWDAIERAVAVFERPAMWRQLMRNAMARDFSWKSSARQYLALYEKVVAERQRQPGR